jgi:uncharacterized protein YjiS (DUF1127 family)
MNTAPKTIATACRHYAPLPRGRRLVYLIGWIGLCIERRRERLRLRELSDAQLRDLGLTRDDAEREALRWPWDGRER